MQAEGQEFEPPCLHLKLLGQRPAELEFGLRDSGPRSALERSGKVPEAKRRGSEVGQTDGSERLPNEAAFFD